MDYATLYPLVLNSSNAVAGTHHSTYRYQFAPGSVKFAGSKDAVASLSLYYSLHSINSSYGNNQFQLIFLVGAGASKSTITIPYRFYTVSELNSFLQQFCITNGLYLIKSVLQ